MEPGLVEGLDDVNVVKLACGDSISLALSSDGKVYSWGSFRVSQICLICLTRPVDHILLILLGRLMTEF